MTTRTPNIVPGEASESDEEIQTSSSQTLQRENSINPLENLLYSDDLEMYDEEASGNIEDSDGTSHVESHNTLLHKKLKEINIRLCNDITDLSRHNLISTAHSLDEINQHLLNDQVTIQKVVQTLRRAVILYEKTDSYLEELLISQQNLPDINIFY